METEVQNNEQHQKRGSNKRIRISLILLGIGLLATAVLFGFDILIIGNDDYRHGLNVFVPLFVISQAWLAVATLLCVKLRPFAFSICALLFLFPLVGLIITGKGGTMAKTWHVFFFWAFWLFLWRFKTAPHVSARLSSLCLSLWTSIFLGDLAAMSLQTEKWLAGRPLFAHMLFLQPNVWIWIRTSLGSLALILAAIAAFKSARAFSAESPDRSTETP